MRPPAQSTRILRLLAIGLPLLASPAIAAPAPEDLTFFETKIRPVLAEKCYSCHSVAEGKRKGGLLVDSRAALLEGGDTDAAIVPGDVDASLLIEAVRYHDPDFQMPPKDKLADAVIKDFEQWVAAGAAWPEEAAPSAADSAGLVEAFDLEKRRAEHWSWQPIAAPEVPTVKHEDWALTPIDHFILARLEKEGLQPAPEADPAAWLRRAAFDLTGLPPTLDELDAFLAEAATDLPAAKERAVDRLLASPHFGERWARHWMDLVRYAETLGHEFDYPLPNAFRYRDYLIRAFNEDLPYDQFLVEHLAGDLVPDPRTGPDGHTNESRLGTGFWFLHEAVHAPTDVKQNEADHIDNQIDVFSRTFLGMTVACARCHDHKFDAISTADYYALAGFLQSSRRVFAHHDEGGKIDALHAELEQRYAEGDRLKATAFGEAPNPATSFSALLLAAEDTLEAHRQAVKEARENSTSILFDDFESATYAERWEVKGKAFGKGPAKGTFPRQQKVDGFAGKGLVNSYNGSDRHTGRMLSKPFTIEKPWINFLIGGGAHSEETSFRLLVDGKPVRRASGKNREGLEPASWNVSEFAGKTARLEIVDAATGGWGHINLDQIAFSNVEETPAGESSREVSPAVVAALARQHGVSAVELTILTEALLSEEAEKPHHPLSAWRTGLHEKKDRAQRLRAHQHFLDRDAAFRAATTELADFSQGLEGWKGEGPAVPRVVTPNGAWTPFDGSGLVAKGETLHNGRTGNRLEGSFRSPTFEITGPVIHLRMKSRNVVVRLVIDGYRLNLRHGLLFGGTVLKGDATDTQGRFAWRSMAGNLDKYIGHRAYLEVIDEGDGYCVIDEVRIAPDKAAAGPVEAASPVTVALAEQLPDEATSRERLAGSYGQLWADAVAKLAKSPRTLTDAERDLLNFAWDSGLFASQRPAAFTAVLEQMQDLNGRLPKPGYALAMEDGTPEDEAVFIRGNPHKRGEIVPRRNLTALGGSGEAVPAEGSGRLELGRHLVEEDNPLVARTLVNRLWHHLFGRGLSPSVDDLGVMGQAPSHPELLDWMARDFQQSGWSIKATLRQMVLSRSYSQRSTPSPANDPQKLASLDPDNVLLYKAPVRRLQAEAIRDAMLSLSGSLDPTIGGPSVPVHLTAFMEGRGRPKSGPLDGEGRRSLYIETRRNFLPPFFLTFDQPIPFTTMGRRSVSNVPAQALALLNDPLVWKEAKLWAEALAKAEPDDLQARLQRAFLQAYSRPPTPAESTSLIAFLEENGSPAKAWQDLCHVLLNKKEFIYLR